MKLFFVTLALLACTTTLEAQKDPAFDNALITRLHQKFRDIQNQAKAREEFLRDLEKLIDEANAKLIAYLKGLKKEEAQMLKEYKPGYHHQPGEMNLFPLWEEIPSPVPSLPEANATGIEQKYESYISKVDLFKKQLADMEEKHTGQQQTDQRQMMNQTIQMANENSIEQQMGGADAIMKMSEKERIQKANELKPGVVAGNPAYSGVPDAGMNAMMQKMMTDPAYRKAYSNMSDAQKQQELQKMMSNTTVKRNDAAFELSLQKKNSTDNIVAVQTLLGNCLQQMQEAAVPYSSGTALANEFYLQQYAAIGRWYNEQYEALLVVAKGETLIQQGVKELDVFKEYIVYSLQKKEAATRTVLWTSLKTRTKIAFGEFNDFIGNYPWGKKQNASLIDGSYTEPQVAKAVYSICYEMIRLTNDAKALTSAHKIQQQQFELITK